LESKPHEHPEEDAHADGPDEPEDGTDGRERRPAERPPLLTVHTPLEHGSLLK
jgi:hypothetical protein